MRIIATLLTLVLFIGGCQTARQIGAAGTLASGALSENLDTTQAEITAAGPHADQVGQTHLQSATAALTAAKGKLPAVNKALALNDSLTTSLAREQGQWWSDRQQRAFWVIVGSIAALTVALVALYFFTSFASPIGSIATVVFHTISLGVFWIGGKFQGWVQGLKIRNITTAEAK